MKSFINYGKKKLSLKVLRTLSYCLINERIQIETIKPRKRTDVHDNECHNYLKGFKGVLQFRNIIQSSDSTKELAYFICKQSCVKN